MNKIILLFAPFLFWFTTLLSQKSKIYLPLNVKKAVEQGTRTLTGVPGSNYWQNRSDYNINVEVVPDSSYLVGNEIINYHNNSPDSLYELVIRLYQDITKVGATRNWYVDKAYLNDGVKLNYIIINNDTLDLSNKSRQIMRGSTILIIYLNSPLAPNSSTEIKCGWEFEIPQQYRIRMGNYGNGNFYIAYWYPQISVYDDIDGWDKIDYAGRVEFYNDFSNYDVKIKVPKGMLVWATGELQNGKELLREDIYKKYQLAQKSDETVNIINQDDYQKGIVTAENEFNYWHFVAKEVTDFSFATSRTSNWDGASIIVDKQTGRRTLTDVIYKDGTIHYDSGAQYAKATIEYLSFELPGYPYPYSHATSYCNGNRGGGMESPMMANNGAPGTIAGHVGLIFHEIAHNYFPFITGTNEKKYAWMDEGWAAFLPTDLVNQYDPDYDYKSRRIYSYEYAAGSEADLPLITPSYSYNTGATRLGFYNRPAVAYYELKELLGKEVFRKGLLEFVNRWAGKHPLPHDFFFTFNEIAGEDLSWFWKPWFYDLGYPDLKLINFRSEDEFNNVWVKKIGNIPTKVLLKFEFEDGTSEIVEKPSSVWKNGNDSIEIKMDNTKIIKSIILGSKYIPDVNSENNILNFLE